MSQDGLRELLEKAASDEHFAQSLKSYSPTSTVYENVSSSEVLALTCADEDALRRLLGSSDLPDVDLALFAEAALPMFDEKMAGEIGGEAAAGETTTQVTSAGVTKCCW